METSNNKLTMLLWEDGKLVGKIVTSENELGNEHTEEDNSESEDVQGFNLPQFMSELKKDIRSKVKSFSFLDIDTDAQNQLQQDVAPNISKTVLVHYKNHSFEFKIMSQDSRESLIERLIATHSIIDRNIVEIFRQSGENFEQLFNRSGLIDWEKVKENDPVILAYGKMDKSVIPISFRVEAKRLRIGNDEMFVYKFAHAEVLESFISRVSIVHKQLKHIRELQHNDVTIQLNSEMLFLPVSFNRELESYSTESSSSSNASSSDDCLSGLSGDLYPAEKSLKLDLDFCQPIIQQDRGNVVSELDWKCYKKGINILGTCNNPECPSADSVYPVCINLHFPTLFILTESQNCFNCSACSHQPINIKTFLVSCVRAKFHFKKVQNDKKETFILEAPSNDFVDYVLLDDSEIENEKKEMGVENEQKFEYDYIELTVVRYGMSFNKCQYCTKSIPLEDERIMGCGRAFHRACLKDDKCPVCVIPEYSLNKLPKFAVAAPRGRVTLSIPNQMYASCPAVRDEACAPSVPAKSIGVFMKALATCQLQNKADNDESSLEFQQNFVIENLPGLIQSTTVNTLLIAKLRQLSILSNYEEGTLSSMANPFEKSRELYKIVPTRISGISSLLVALEETKQSGAVKILSGYYSYKSK